MITNAIDISHDIRAAGAQPEVAEAIAKAIATHSNEHLMTKTDAARLEAKFDTRMGAFETRMSVLETKFNIMIVLMAGMLVAFLSDKL